MEFVYELKKPNLKRCEEQVFCSYLKIHQLDSLETMNEDIQI